MAGPGGARPGAGRKRKSEKFAGQIAKAEKRIADRLAQCIDNLQMLADGVLVEEFNIATGKPMVFQRPPDRQANEYLLNRIMGKPTERQEITGSDGDPIPVEFFNHDAAITKLTEGSEDDPEAPE
jgi:hypothetical protein